LADDRDCQSHGITRVARITGLDRLSVEVWQAIRPTSRSLSVHAGKGRTRADAIASALGEALEFAVSERWWRSDFVDAPDDRRDRPGAPWDCAWGPASSTDPLDWVHAEPLARQDFAVPSAFLSLDFCRQPPAGMRVSSCGGASAPSAESATTCALLELIERDAVARWLASPLIARSMKAVDPAIHLDPEIALLVGAARRSNFFINFFALAAAVPVAVAGCEIRDVSAPPDLRVDGFGAAARTDWPTALADAFLEAAQVRACVIAGARDEIIDRQTVNSYRGVGFSLPMPPGVARPSPAVACPQGLSAAELVSWLAERLAEAGYPHVGRVVMSEPSDPMVVVRAVVPGLRRLPPSAAERWLNE